LPAVDRLSYLGHSTTLLRIDGVSLLTDPALRAWIGPLRRRGALPDRQLAAAVDAVLVSHLHRDHLDLRSLRRLPSSTPAVVPRGAGGVASKALTDVVEVAASEAISIGTVTVTAVPAAHDGRRARWGPRADALGYVIAGGSRRVYFAGDTDLFDEMSELAPLDLALLPVWGWGPSLSAGHLDPAGAARALTLLRPRLAVPIHWGTFYPLGLRRLRPDRLSRPPLEFATLAAELAPEVEVRILKPGEMMSL
jgi:L-ascorbate metabolism protein UlaG (beta-lactamase superfamily)